MAEINVAELAEQLNVTDKTVLNKIKGKDFEGWVADRKWAIESGLGKTCQVFRHPDGLRCAVPIVRDLTGLGTSTISTRLNKWSEGNIDCDELCMPPQNDKEKECSGHANWGELTGENRAHRLADIPSPTEYDRRYGR